LGANDVFCCVEVVSQLVVSMIIANHSWFFDKFFNWYIHRILNNDFDHINVVGEWDVGSESCLLIGNHVSWWDGFWVYYLNKTLLNKKFHVMMLEQQLSQRPFLSKIGAFSIYPGKRSVLNSLNYAIQKLKEPANLVVMYPQGKIAPFSAGILPFQTGVQHIIKKSGLTKVLFYAAFVDYLSRRKPSLTLYLGSESVLDTGVDIESKYQNFYTNSVSKHAGIIV
jgi:1-acyl-sn-glycerol-3-phosphate acyltransferase